MNRNQAIVTSGVMLGLFLASIEGTIVNTAMPTIIGQLGGLAIYAWVSSAYSLTSTSTTPVFGKLADMYGIRPVYIAAVVLFLGGSMLSGTAHSMEQLVLYRAIQGLGAGGLLPLAFTIVGSIFSMEQRAKTQGLFSGVWGVSSVVGPVIGGFIVGLGGETWRWIFYLNIPFGLAAAALIWFNLKEERRQHVKHSIDYSGIALLVGGVVSLLLMLFEGPNSGWGSPLVIGLGVASMVLLGLFVWNELRVPEPIIAPSLFSGRLFTVGSLHGFLSGMAMFGSLLFLPLFAQGVIGLDPTAAGAALTPAMLGWTLSSIVGGRLMLRYGYRKVAIGSMIIMSAGAFVLSRIGVDTTQWQLMTGAGLLGTGMGAGVTAYIIMIQGSVSRQQMGSATSTLQFTRSIGGTIGVSLFGTVMSTRLADGLRAAGLDAAIDPRDLLQRGANIPPQVLHALQGALADGISAVFALAFGVTVLCLAVVWLLSPQPAATPAAEPAPGTPIGLSE
ncbi:MAG: MFS transporter [Chloroflexi bacterium]|nr:MFS transporter [Chloroflexota bacterium]